MSLVRKQVLAFAKSNRRKLEQTLAKVSGHYTNNYFLWYIFPI